jgi:hypothetical protein
MGNAVGDFIMTKAESKFHQSPTNWLIIGILFDFIFFVQFIGLVRYHNNVSDDPTGVIIYLVTISVSGLAAMYYYVKWKREKRKLTLDIE